MPQREFELYLKLLANLLDLEPSQREEIRDEMRDHLEERLAELSELGVSREEAVERALDEFGDAAGLAGSFTTLAKDRLRRRRVLVYRSTASAVAVTLTILAAFAFWPTREGVIAPPVAVAQQPAPDPDRDPFGVQPKPAARPAAPDPQRAKVEEALAKPVKVQFLEIPFDEAIEFVSEVVQLDILIDEQALAEVGIQPDMPTTLELRHAEPPARTVIELLLDGLGAGDGIGVEVDDGFARVTAVDVDALEVEVYDVRDLVAAPRPPGEGFEAERGAGLGGGFGAARLEAPAEGIDGLLHVIATTVSPSTWDALGGPGTIAAFDGMLVIGNSSDVHRRVQALLDKLRSARAKPAVAEALPR